MRTLTSRNNLHHYDKEIFNSHLPGQNRSQVLKITNKQKKNKKQTNKQKTTKQNKKQKQQHTLKILYYRRVLHLEVSIST